MDVTPADDARAAWIHERTLEGERVVAFTGCARCGGSHELAFAPIERPVETVDHTFGWWVSCPITGEPILLEILPLEAAP